MGFAAGQGRSRVEHGKDIASCRGVAEPAGAPPGRNGDCIDEDARAIPRLPPPQRHEERLVRPLRSHRDRVALVLSGGGARGAYEAGVLAGIVDVLGSWSGDAPLFGVLSGASVGAIGLRREAAELAPRAPRSRPASARDGRAPEARG